MRAGGYTLVELIAVLLIVGVLAAIGIPRLMDSGTGARAYALEVGGGLRQAQKSALAHRRLVCVDLSVVPLRLSIASSNPAPAGGCDRALPVTDVAGPARDPGLATALALRGNTAPLPPQPTMLYFQPDGSVSADAAGTLPVSATVTISIGNAPQAQVSIEGSTGHVQ